MNELTLSIGGKDENLEGYHNYCLDDSSKDSVVRAYPKISIIGIFFLHYAEILQVAFIRP